MLCRLQRHWSLAVIAILTVGLAAQEKPDFSGRWVLVTSQQQPDGDVPSELSVHQTVVQTTVRGEPMKPYVSDISIGRQFATGLRSETHQIGVIGGNVSGPDTAASQNDPNVHHAVRWEGDTLILEGGSHSGPRPRTGVWKERREAWSLDADGRLRIVLTVSGSSNAAQTITLMYRRP